MPYVNFTLDAGACVIAYRMSCNYPDKFSKIALHLGDFHFMKDVFIMLGTLVKGSGFEDVIFQAGVCSTGTEFYLARIIIVAGLSTVSWEKR